MQKPVGLLLKPFMKPMLIDNESDSLYTCNWTNYHVRYGFFLSKFLGMPRTWDHGQSQVIIWIFKNLSQHTD